MPIEMNHIEEDEIKRSVSQVQPVDRVSEIHGASQLSTEDLADLMSKFNEVTTKLEQTHGQLRSEVSRLNTELRQANEALERSRRLAALGEMAAGISHEIRNPLGSIRLYANMLKDDLAQLPEQRQIVEKIGRAVGGLDEIVGDVLTFAREMRVQWQPCDVMDVCTQAIEAGLGEFDCHVDDSDVQSCDIECDLHLLSQAIINVLRNAGEANKATGKSKLEFSTREEVLEINGRVEDVVVFAVRDQGDGIPDQVIERMFNPFFTTRATGTGLGLAIVHRIIDAHHGIVRVVLNKDIDPSELPENWGVGGTLVELCIPKSPALVTQRASVRLEPEIVVGSPQISSVARGS